MPSSFASALDRVNRSHDRSSADFAKRLRGNALRIADEEWFKLASI
jgi:hypothetical protein